MVTDNGEHEGWAVGQRVRLTYDRQQRGVVRGRAERTQGGYRYQVALATAGSVGDVSPWFVEEDLEALAEDAPRWLNRDEFLRELLLIKLRHPLTDTLYDFRASRTDFLPFQYIPVLKFLENPDQRILIADEVGLGKTIEACLIYRELEARRPLNGVLVVCPSVLREKWQGELRERYDEEFDILNSAGLERLVAEYQNPFGRNKFRSIISYETLRQRGNEELLVSSGFEANLIIFDEAHRMRNRQSMTYTVASSLTNKAEAIVMLTATPLHTSNENLYNLLHMLSPADFEGMRDFEERVGPNRYINAAIRSLREGEFAEAREHLKLAENDHFIRRSQDLGEYQKLSNDLNDLALGDYPPRQKVIRVQREINDLHTLSDIFSRTRKRDVAKIAIRRAISQVVEPHELEASFYQAILEDAKKDIRRRGIRAVGFLAVSRERRAASCLQVLKDHCICSMKQDDRKVNGAVLGVAMPEDSSNIENNAKEEKWTYSAKTQDLALKLKDMDSKRDELIKVIINELDRRVEKGEKPAKILLFATYRGTLDYLHEQLKPIFEERGLRYDLIRGGVPIPKRHRIIDDFRKEANFRLLLSSEVGGEGLDFQFCEILINYDMPWNPMRVEQRIGRLDRIGQEREVIRIINFYMGNTVDTRILQRLHERIQLFEHSIGDLEEILGEKTNHLSKIMFDPNISDGERERQQALALMAILNEKENNKELAEKEDQIIGNKEIFDAQMADLQASGRIIHAEEVRATVQSYLMKEFPNIRMRPNSNNQQWHLYGNEALANRIRHYRDHRKRSGETIPAISDEFLNGLVTGGRRNPRKITFANEEARRSIKQDVEFITHHHALAQLALDYWRRQYDGAIPALGGLEMEAERETSSNNYYFLFVMNEYGLRERRTLRQLLIGDDGMIDQIHAERVLGRLHEFKRDTFIKYSDEGWEKANKMAYQVMDYWRNQLADDLNRQNFRDLELTRYRIQRNHDARVGWLQDQLLGDKSLEERIVRMRRGEIRNLEIQLEEDMKQLDQKSQVSVSYELVATGRVRLLPPAATHPNLADILPTAGGPNPFASEPQPTS